MFFFVAFPKGLEKREVIGPLTLRSRKFLLFTFALVIVIVAVFVVSSKK